MGQNNSVYLGILGHSEPYGVCSPPLRWELTPGKPFIVTRPIYDLEREIAYRVSLLRLRYTNNDGVTIEDERTAILVPSTAELVWFALNVLEPENIDFNVVWRRLGLPDNRWAPDWARLLGAVSREIEVSDERWYRTQGAELERRREAVKAWAGDW